MSAQLSRTLTAIRVPFPVSFARKTSMALVPFKVPRRLLMYAPVIGLSRILRGGDDGGLGTFLNLKFATQPAGDDHLALCPEIDRVCI